MSILCHRVYSGEAYCRLCLRFSDEATLYTTKKYLNFIQETLNIKVSESEHVCAFCSRRIQNSEQLIADVGKANFVLHAFLQTYGTNFTASTEIIQWEKNLLETRVYRTSEIRHLEISTLDPIEDNEKGLGGEGAPIKIENVKEELDLDANNDLNAFNSNCEYSDRENALSDNSDIKCETIPLSCLLEYEKKHKRKDKRFGKNGIEIRKRRTNCGDKFRIINLSRDEIMDDRNRLASGETYMKSRYKCEGCVLHFPTELLYEKHLEKHDKHHGPHSCDICRLSFDSKSTLDNHRQEHEQRYECVKCGMRAETKAIVKKHVLIHKVGRRKKINNFDEDLNDENVQSEDRLMSDDGSGVLIVRLTEEQRQDWLAQRRLEKAYIDAVYRCDTCVKGFLIPEAYEAHLEKHKSSYGAYPCHVCGQYTKSSSSLASHRLLHYRRYACAQCPYNAAARKAVLEHVDEKHSNKRGDVLKCQHCEKTFVKLSYLRKHELRHTSSKALCTVCNKWLRNNDTLRTHMLQHPSNTSKEKQKRFSCKSCTARYRWIWQLRIHETSHSDHRPFYCQQCSIAFKTIAGIRAHQKRKHQKMTRFECDYCRRTFPVKAELAMHINGVHLKREISKCTSCEKSFINDSRLRAHIRQVHQKSERRREHICHVCGKAFHSSHLLDCHIRTHTGERPYPCPMCPRTFAQSGVARRHYRVVHLKTGGRKSNGKVTKTQTDNEGTQETLRLVNQKFNRRNSGQNSVQRFEYTAWFDNNGVSFGT